MKNIKVCLILMALTQGIASVASRNIEPSREQSCYDEARQLSNAANKCAPPNLALTDIIDRIVEFRNHTITATEFSQSAIDYCKAIKMVISCSLEKAANFHSSCHNFPNVEYQINMFRLADRIETEICSEQILYKIANDPGYICLENTDFQTCQKSRVQRPGPNQYYLDNANICSFIQSYQDCSPQIFNQCEHDGEIMKYADRVQTALNAEFSCIINEKK